jgi:hypothetical protein
MFIVLLEVKYETELELLEETKLESAETGQVKNPTEETIVIVLVCPELSTRLLAI